MSNLTIVVQGPFNIVSLTNLETYAKFGRVVVAGWQNIPEDLMRSVVEACRVAKAELVIMPAISCDSCMNPQNVFYQCHSTLQGLRRVTTRFAIKVRSDEAYENLEPVIERLHRDPQRIWSGSVFFRRDIQHKFHAGDHILAGDRQILARGFKYARTTCATMVPIPLAWQPLPEQIITRSLLIAKGEHPTFSKSRELMLRHFGPLSLKMFGKLSCKLHLPKRGTIVRDYIHKDDRGIINGSGTCVHDSIEEI
jgi:hypothetical protein